MGDMTDIEKKLKERGGSASHLVAGLAERAQAEGLVDIAYSFVDSPLGRLLAARTERGLIRLSYPNRDPDQDLEQLAEKVSPRILEMPARLDDIRRELDEYFEGKRRDFDLDIDWRLTAGFTRKILKATARIPFGRTLSYKEIAAKAGNERASRAAGNALGSNDVPIVVPCHRVLHTGGGVGGYTGGLDKKIYLLELEGVL